MRMNLSKKSAALGVLAAVLFGPALSGCVNLGPKVPDTLLNLTSEQVVAPGTSASGSYDGAIVVLEPESSQRLNVTRVPVQVDEANIAYLKNATWVDRPARLFQRLLAEAIRADGGRLVLETDPGASAQRLSGRLLDMGYDARSRSVIVRFDAIREQTGGGVESRRFESVVPNVDADAEDVGIALNRASNAVAAQVAEWVR